MPYPKKAKNLRLYVLGFILCIFLDAPCYGAKGSLIIISPNPKASLEVEDGLTIKGRYILIEDNEPSYTTGSTSYCVYATSFLPFVAQPMTYRYHAYLRYRIDEGELHDFKSICSSFNWTQIGEEKEFSLKIDTSYLDPGFHTLWIILQDVFGVRCYSPPPKNIWSYLRGHYGDIIDQKIIRFKTGEPNLANEDTGKRCNRGYHVEIGSSVNIANGNLFYEHEISPNIKLPITLYYNSRSKRHGIFGFGWSSRLDVHLVIGGKSTILIDEDGWEGKFKSSGSAEFKSPPGNHDKLSKTPCGYRLLRKSGISIDFDKNGRLIQLADKNDNKTLLVYEGQRLKSVTDPYGQMLSFEWDDNDHISKITDETGRSTYFFYDQDDNLTQIKLPADEVWKFTYDNTHNLISKTDPLGQTTCYTYDSEDRLTESVDPQGNVRTVDYLEDRVVRMNDPIGNVTEYTFTRNQNLLKKVDPLGNTTEYTWDEDFNKTSVSDSSGIITYTYDQEGNLLSRTDQLGHTLHFTYDHQGNILTIIDPLDRVTVMTYDENGNVICVKDPAGNTTKYEYDEKGRIVKIIDPIGRVTTQKYDEQGNLERIIDPRGAAVSMRYDLLGRVIAATDPSGNTTQFEYDLRNRLISIIDAKGNVTKLEYDKLGNLISITDANRNTTWYEHDYKGRVTKIIDALGHPTVFTYAEFGCPSCSDNGKSTPSSLTDANGNITLFQYDPLGRLVRETDALGNSTAYEYDPRGNLISRTDANGATTRYVYDPIGRLLRKIYPDQSEVIYEYDASGNLVFAANQFISYFFEYDVLDRLIRITDSNNRSIFYEYDATGNIIRMTMPDGKTVEFDYDESNRLVEIGSEIGNFHFGYDASGHRIFLHYPSGTNASYKYDELNHLIKLEIKNRAGKALDTFSYSFDDTGNRISKIETFKCVKHALRHDYAYDKTYRLLSSKFSLLRKNAHRKLIKKQEIFDYDPVGNRLSGPDHKEVYSYNVTNQLIYSNKYNYQYDANGNLIFKKGTDGTEASWIFKYDYENRLIRAEQISRTGKQIKTVSFKYDPFGRRIEKKVESDRHNSVTYTYVYDHEDIIQEFQTVHRCKRLRRKKITYIHGPGVDEPLARIEGELTFFYHADGLGSIVSLTDKHGKIVLKNQYSAFGLPKITGARIRSPYAFTGREWDREIGLYYYRARYYDPSIGRFICEDPMGFDGGDVNLYVYVGNNPLLLIDPWGLCDSIVFTIWKDVKYSVGRATTDLVNIATNGPAPAKVVLGLAAITEIGPLMTISAIEVGASALNFAYQNPEIVLLAEKAVWDAIGEGRPGITKLVINIINGENPLNP